MAVLTVRTVRTAGSILTMVNGYLTTFAQIYCVTDYFSVFIDVDHTCNIIIVLKSIDNGLKSINVAVQLVNHSLKRLERLPCRNLKLRSVCESEYDIIRICGVDTLEERIAVFAVLTSTTLRTLRALLTGSLTKVCPGCTVIVRHIPETVFDLQKRSHAILAVSSILTRNTWQTICTILTWSTRSTILTVGTCSLHLVAILIHKPAAVNCPVVDTVCILLDADHRCMAVLTVRTVRTAGSILTMVDSNFATLCKSDHISYLLQTIVDWRNSYDIVVILQCLNNCLKRCNIAVHLGNQHLKGFKCRPSRNLDLNAICKSNCHIIFCNNYILEQRITILAICTWLTICAISASCYAQTHPCRAIII